MKLKALSTLIASSMLYIRVLLYRRKKQLKSHSPFSIKPNLGMI